MIINGVLDGNLIDPTTGRPIVGVPGGNTGNVIRCREIQSMSVLSEDWRPLSPITRFIDNNWLSVSPITNLPLTDQELGQIRLDVGNISGGSSPPEVRLTFRRLTGGTDGNLQVFSGHDLDGENLSGIVPFAIPNDGQEHTITVPLTYSSDDEFRSILIQTYRGDLRLTNVSFEAEVTGRLTLSTGHYVRYREGQVQEADLISQLTFENGYTDTVPTTTWDDSTVFCGGIFPGNFGAPPFGGTSYYQNFNECGDYLRMSSDSTGLTMAMDQFTIECQIYYRVDTGGDRLEFTSDQNIFSGGSLTSVGLFISYQDFSVLMGYGNGGFRGITGAVNSVQPNDQEWNHIAFVKDGLDLRVYVRGMLSASGSLSPTDPPPPPGVEFSLACYNQNMDDFVFSRTAKYNSNFTPPGPLS